MRGGERGRRSAASWVVALTALWWCAPSQARDIQMVPQVGHTSSVLHIDWRSDSQRFVTTGEDGVAKVWDTLSRALVTNYGDDLFTAVWASDGERILSITSDGVVIWDAKRGEALVRIDAMSTVAASWSPDDGEVWTASWEGQIGRWDAETGARLQALDTEQRVETASWSSDGARVLLRSGMHLEVWDVEGSRRISRYEHEDYVEAVAWSPDGARVASLDQQGVPHIWDPDTGAILDVLWAFEEAFVMTLAWSPDGRYLAFTDWDWAGTVYDVERAEVVTRFEWPEGASALNGVAWSPRGDALISKSSEDGSVVTWDAQRGELLGVTVVDASTDDAVNAWSPDGRHIVTGGADGGVVVWDAASGSIEVEFVAAPLFGVHATWWSPDGRWLVTLNEDDSGEIWDAHRGALHRAGVTLEDADLPSWVREPGLELEAGRKGGRRIVEREDDAVAVEDVETGEVLAVAPVEGGSSRTRGWSPDGRRALLGARSSQGLVMIWDIEAGAIAGALEHEHPVSVARWSPDGGSVATGDFRGGIRLWSSEDGALRDTLHLHADGVSCLAWSPDGRHIASGSNDGTIRVWEVATGEVVTAFTEHVTHVNDLAWSPTGERIASSGYDGVTWIWTVDGRRSVALQNAGEAWVVYTRDDEGRIFFDASQRGGALLAMVSKGEPYGIDQFALFGNRPDAIMRALGADDPVWLEHYQRQHERRLRKFRRRLERAGFTGELHEPSPDLEVPVAEILSATQEEEGVLTLELSFRDRQPLAFYQIYVNDVPLFEGAGQTCEVELGAGDALRRVARVELTPGVNKIEVSVTNVRGVESYRALTIAEYEAAIPGELYYVGFGVSDYADDSLDLAYAHKDAQDLARVFARSEGYSAVHTLTYVDAEVTLENIERARALLEEATVHDTVVLFIAGHGLYDEGEEPTYYYLTHETRLEDLAGTAAPFEMIEGLLGGIAPREKLFLMDTCESGEQADAVYGATLADARSRGLRSRGLPKRTRRARPRRPHLQERGRFIYDDLTRRTGAIVFSSSRGGELSYESDAVENGLFTEAILEVLTREEADGVVSTKELRARVSRVVPEMSRGLQHPTVDRDNLFVSFGFTPVVVDDVATLPEPPGAELPRVQRGPRGCACRVGAPVRRGDGALMLALLSAWLLWLRGASSRARAARVT